MQLAIAELSHQLVLRERIHEDLVRCNMSVMDGRVMFKKGDLVEILPDFQDKGDDEFHWVVLADEEKGRVDICHVDIALQIKPRYTVASNQIRLRHPDGEGIEEAADPHTLALEFSASLRARLSPEEMKLVISRNGAETHPNICHSHDFCDANAVLLEIFLAHGMDPADEGGMERWGDLWDKTWTLAKGLGFDVAQLIQVKPMTALQAPGDSH